MPLIYTCVCFKASSSHVNTCLRHTVPSCLISIQLGIHDCNKTNIVIYYNKKKFNNQFALPM